MRKIRLISPALLICFFLGACAEPEQAPHPDFKQLVLENYIAPFKNAETERWMKVFAEDAVGMHNTLPAFVGKAAIQQFADIVEQNLNIEQLDVIIDDVQVNGSWALTRGSFTSKLVPNTLADTADIPSQLGKFILLWEKQENGGWQVILDMGNSSEPNSPPS